MIFRVRIRLPRPLDPPPLFLSPPHRPPHPAARSPTWHVIVGTNYGTHVVHATKNFIYFYLGPKAILIFKSG